MRIDVVAQGAVSGEDNAVSVSGGGAPGAQASSAVGVGGDPGLFGAEDYGLAGEEEGGALVTQAGAHPFQLTTTIAVKQTADANPLNEHPKVTSAGGLVKDLAFDWPQGTAGNATPFPQCTLAQFLKIVNTFLEENECSPQSAVGVATVTVYEPASFGMLTFPVPVFNLEPGVGQPARFGFAVPIANVAVLVDPSVRTGGDYGVTVTSHNVTQAAALLSATVAVWGVPGDPRHDSLRGWGCLAEASEGMATMLPAILRRGAASAAVAVVADVVHWPTALDRRTGLV